MRLLGRMMQGQQVPACPVLIKPTVVIARHSTGTSAVADELVAQALRYIRENSSQPINVNDVVAAVPASRRNLEVRFRRALGTTIHDAVWSCRQRVAQEMLTGTGLSLSQIATRTGFGQSAVFTRSFRMRSGKSPSEYRRRCQVAGPWPAV